MKKFIPSEFSRRLSQMKKEMQIKECFYPQKEQCIKPIKRAHSLQRNGRLSLLEGEINGQMKVYSGTSFESSEIEMIEDFVPIGKSMASTFFGFCEKHDTDVFSVIENKPFDHSEEHLFLHSYRSFAHSYHSKKQELQLYKSDWETLEVMPKELRDQRILGCELAMKDLEVEKGFLDKLLINKQYEYLDYSVLETNDFHPIGCSSIVTPHVTPKGSFIDEWSDDPEKPVVSLMLTVVPDINNSFVILAGNPDCDGARRFIDDLEELSDTKYKHALSTLMTVFAENMFWSPKLWSKLSLNQQSAIREDARFILGDDLWDRFPWSKINLFMPMFGGSVLKI